MDVVICKGWFEKELHSLQKKSYIFHRTATKLFITVFVGKDADAAETSYKHSKLQHSILYLILCNLNSRGENFYFCWILTIALVPPVQNTNILRLICFDNSVVVNGVFLYGVKVFAFFWNKSIVCVV